MIPVQQAIAFSANVDIVNREALERIAKTLAAEVRRLREENDSQRFDILAMNQSLDLMREENERLRKDAERYRWLSDDGGIHSLPYDDFGCGPVFDLSREALDAARGHSSQTQNGGGGMTASQIKTLLEDIVDISEQVGIIRGQRTCHGYSQQDAITEHGLRSILHEKKQDVLHMTVENWQPIHKLTPEVLLTNVVDVWSKRHGRITDVTHGAETYGQGVAGGEVGVVYQSYYDCNGPVYEIVKDATHWMIVKGPVQ